MTTSSPCPPGPFAWNRCPNRKYSEQLSPRLWVGRVPVARSACIDWSSVASPPSLREPWVCTGAGLQFCEGRPSRTRRSELESARIVATLHRSERGWILQNDASALRGIGVDGQQVRVLVVDDDPLVRRAVRLTCESEGYTVQEAERAGEALARLEVFHPDVVVLDIVLPDLSGFDVCREIRRAGHRMPVIILSAKHDEIDVVLGLEIGADDYIAKPFRPRELLARIGAHVRRAREQRGDDKPSDGRLIFRDLVIDTAERRV